MADMACQGGKLSSSGIFSAASELRSTLRLFVFVMAVVFFSEALIMLVLPALLADGQDAMTGALIDASLLSGISSFVILPVMLRFRRRAEKAEQAINITDDGYWVVDREGRFLEVNDGYCRMIGYSREELLTMSVADVEAVEDPRAVQAHIEQVMTHAQDRFETRHRHRSGRLVEIEVSVVRVGVGTMVVFLRDITDRKRTVSEIHNLAFYDTLTGLPNRRLLIERVQHALARSARQQSYSAVMFLDLDNFKTLNDTRGHSQGDLLLRGVAGRLRDCLRREDTVARQGGDEFVILVEDLCDQPDQAAYIAEALAEKLRGALNRPFVLDGHEFQTSSSIGISLFFGAGLGVDQLLRQADTAMYQAKKAGRNRLAFFQPAMQHALELRSNLERDLRRALERGQFELFYQPQLDRDGTVRGAEALLRWRHPGRGLVSPAEFIPLAEETGLIVPIGMWVLETACQCLRDWAGDPALRDLELSVNVSAHQFHQADFVPRVRDLLDGGGACAERLKLELTETAMLENIEESVAKMRTLRALGVSFAMDDFGTGHSSLTNLKRLPIDQIKVDQSFVRDLTHDASDMAIVRTIIVMAESLGLDVIAEGVETLAQCELLDQYGCRGYQGYLFGRPVPLAVFVARVRAAAEAAAGGQ
jgi:diguanylate cyclase (GGDEF)-like protein/PAS domain S-box-containing protein